MMNYKLYLIWLVCLFGCTLCTAQEYRVGINSNPQLAGALKNDKHYKESPIHITLPFFDNFKQLSLVPNPELWSDKEVFVNSTFQLYPLNRGVATFDVLNQYGYVYPQANDISFFADSLTSNYIKLGATETSDSLYFSFFYQPQGRGDRPEVQDSLMVKFQMKERDTIVSIRDSLTDSGETIQLTDTVVKDKWFKVFADRGHDIKEFKDIHGEYWRLVMIKLDHSIFTSYIEKLVRLAILYYIDTYKDEHDGAMPPNNEIEEMRATLTDEMNGRYDTVFFHDNFRFRFLNKASISPSALQSWQGNCDQWNIDNVYLNIGRTMNDTLYREEICFIESGRTFLNNYTAVPYRQYNNDPIVYLADSISTFIYNGFSFDDGGENYLYYKYRIYDKDEKLLYTYSAKGATKARSYVTDKTIARPPVEYIFPVNKDNQTPFKIVQTVNYEDTPSEEITAYSDKIEYWQMMTDYFAYDDGTAELGYGLKGSGSMCAVKFELNTKDTLRGVRMYFNNTLEEANEKPFRIAVWRDNDLGQPGEIIYLDKTTSMPGYTGENQFIDFALDTEVEVRPTNLYVGWLQVYKENLNIGWDTSNPQRDNIFVYVPGEGKWRNTDYNDGCLMIRPLFKSQLTMHSSQLADDDLTFKVYPNPVVNSQFTIHKAQWSDDDVIEIYNLAGNRIYSRVITMTSNDELYVVNCELKSGLYVVRVINGKTGKYSNRKIVVH